MRQFLARLYRAIHPRREGAEVALAFFSPATRVVMQLVQSTGRGFRWTASGQGLRICGENTRGSSQRCAPGSTYFYIPALFMLLLHFLLEMLLLAPGCSYICFRKSA